MMQSPIRLALLFFTGSMLLQVSWITSLPPFRGIDEFDHAYRAAAVAEGQWKPDYIAAKEGRGWYLKVPRSLVDAATPVCESYRYTGPENCKPVTFVGDSHVTVASAAAKYSPVYYWIVGTPSLLFDSGEAKVLAMRVAGSLICSLFLALIAWILATWSTTRWPLVALSVTMTPVVVYSTALGAPNGLEMLAGLCVWTALLGLARTSDTRRRLLLLYAALPAAVALVGMRAIGPFWLAMIVVSVIAIIGLKRARSVINSLLVHVSSAALVVMAATAGAGWWILATGMSTEPEGPGGYGNGSLQMHLTKSILWVLQSIAAFPVRNERAPTVVYACGLVAILCVLFIGVRRSERRVARAIVVTSITAIAVSSFFNFATFDSWGSVWQGRYALPYTIGVPIVAAFGLDTRSVSIRFPAITIGLGALLVGIAQTVSVVHVLGMERVKSPLANTGAWHIPPDLLVALLTLAGVAFWAVGCLAARTSESPTYALTTANPEVAPL